MLIIWPGRRCEWRFDSQRRSGESIPKRATWTDSPGAFARLQPRHGGPELNPTELVWNQLKQGLKNQVFLSLTDLTATVLEQIRLLEKDRKLVQLFFHKKEIAFFTN
ncbi:hypothetical protein [Spirosoma flavum]|uniref:Tc1-like transposase DDE domain-containing protein n=1 Tax=Spirosoma flavum TaxID=2048557 RepID=A0ABW6AMN7_9BACT